MKVVLDMKLDLVCSLKNSNIKITNTYFYICEIQIKNERKQEFICKSKFLDETRKRIILYTKNFH